MLVMLQPSSAPVSGSASGPARVNPAGGVYAGAFRRLLVIAVIAWWLGGFTFYSGVAVPVMILWPISLRHKPCYS